MIATAAIPEHSFVSILGLELHVTEWGIGNPETVICWHGLARTGRDFDELAAMLSRLMLSTARGVRLKTLWSRV